MSRPRVLVHLASDTNRWGACGHARGGVEQTTDPEAVTCGHCRKHIGAGAQSSSADTDAEASESGGS